MGNWDVLIGDGSMVDYNQGSNDSDSRKEGEHEVIGFQNANVSQASLTAASGSSAAWAADCAQRGHSLRVPLVPAQVIGSVHPKRKMED